MNASIATSPTRLDVFGGVTVSRRKAAACIATISMLLATVACSDSSSLVFQDAESGWKGLSPSASVVSGQNQEGEAGSILSEPLRIKVVDAAGMPLRNLSVQWTFSAGGGAAAGANAGQASQSLSVPTDNQGQSSVVWRLGPKAGGQSATAVVSPPGKGKSKGNLLTVTFPANATAGAPAQVSVDPDHVQLAPGNSQVLRAVVADRHGNPVYGGTVGWHSTASTTATVDAQGLVKASQVGTTTIVAMIEGTTGEGTVEVLPAAPTAFALLAGDAQVGVVGEPLGQPLVVGVTDDAGRGVPGVSVSWTVSPGGGTVTADPVTTDSNGQAQTTWTLGSAPGEHTAVATAAELDDATFSATAHAGPVATVSISPSSAEIQPGENVQLTVSSKDAHGNTAVGKKVTWGTSDASIASVSSGGMVEGVAEGTAEATVSVDGAAASASIQVSTTASPTIASVTIDPASWQTSQVGGSRVFSARAWASSGDQIQDVTFTWSSSDPSVATVDASGRVTMKTIGAAVITTMAACCSASAQVSLTEAAPSGDVGALIQQWEQAFLQNEPGHDQYFRTKVRDKIDYSAVLNYYDRAWAYYRLADHFGDDSYRTKGDEYADMYISEYFGTIGYDPPPRQSQMQGLVEYYRRTGDTRARDGLVTNGDALWLRWAGYSTMEGRIAARTLMSFMMAQEVQPDPRWDTRARTIVDYIANWQRSDGMFEMSDACNGQVNYMVGLLSWVLIRYYEEYEADPRIPGILERAARYMWDSEWWPHHDPSQPDSKVFRYVSTNCEGTGSVSPGNDLNGLILPLFAWHRQPGDIRAHVPDLLEGMLQHHWIDGYSAGGAKQWTQFMRTVDSFQWLP